VIRRISGDYFELQYVARNVTTSYAPNTDLPMA
jgi:hypothetical protein